MNEDIGGRAFQPFQAMVHLACVCVCVCVCMCVCVCVKESEKKENQVRHVGYDQLNEKKKGCSKLRGQEIEC